MSEHVIGEAILFHFRIRQLELRHVQAPNPIIHVVKFLAREILIGGDGAFRRICHKGAEWETGCYRT